jgi:lipopolysaccharide export LptBFGC system permease protein LptF
MKGSIYLIQSNGKNYVGSTPRKVEYRITEHKNKGVFKLYDMNPNEYSLKILEIYEYKQKIELRKREQYYMDQYECVNKIKAYSDKKESDRKLYMKNREERIKKASEYQKSDKAKLQRKQRYEYKKSWGELYFINL